MSIFYWVYWSTGHNFKVAAWCATVLMGLIDSTEPLSTVPACLSSETAGSLLHTWLCAYGRSQRTQPQAEKFSEFVQRTSETKYCPRPPIWLLCSPFEVFEVQYVTVLKWGSRECRDIIKMNAKASIIIAIICSERGGLKTSHNNINRQANDIFFKKNILDITVIHKS